MKAEPQPNYDVNRECGTDSDNGCWLRRLVRQHGQLTHNLGRLLTWLRLCGITRTSIARHQNENHGAGFCFKKAEIGASSSKNSSGIFHAFNSSTSASLKSGSLSDRQYSIVHPYFWTRYMTSASRPAFRPLSSAFHPFSSLSNSANISKSHAKTASYSLQRSKCSAVLFSIMLCGLWCMFVCDVVLSNAVREPSRTHDTQQPET